jgi:hypothetical protein
MGLIHQGTWATLQAIDDADISNDDTAIIYYNNRARTFTFNAISTEAEKNTRPGPYYLRPHDYSTGGVWEETIGNDYDFFNGGQMIGSVLQSTNWGASAGSQYDLDDGTIKLGGSTSPSFSVTAGGDVTIAGTWTSNANIEIKGGADIILENVATPGKLIFKGTNDIEVYRIATQTDSLMLTGNLRISRASDITDYLSIYNDATYCYFNRVTNGGTTGDMCQFDSAGNINFNGGWVSMGGTSLNNAVLTLDGNYASLCMKEITTPTANTNYGKIYTKTDNKLYFQDGAGSEHTVAFV